MAAYGKLRKEDLIGGLVGIYPGFLLVQLSWKRCFRAVEASEFTLTTIIIIIHTGAKMATDDEIDDCDDGDA